MSRLRISIVTPSYNQGHYLKRTIDSIITQQGDFDLDYRVYDGGSTDTTLDVLRSYGDRVRWVSEKDKGQIDAINKGLRAATGDVVGWVNSDDTLRPGALARVAAAFASDPHVEWVHGRCAIIDENDREIRRWVSLYKHLRCKRHSFQNLLTENYISQMAAFWKRDVHQTIGYLDPTHDLSFDYELFLKLAERGDPIYIEDELACFRWYDTSKSGAGFARQIQQANDIARSFGDYGMWVRARTGMKKLAVVNVYRALVKARTAGIPL